MKIFNLNLKNHKERIKLEVLESKIKKYRNVKQAKHSATFTSIKKHQMTLTVNPWQVTLLD